MHKFKLLSIKCKMCDWQWELTPQEKTEDTRCEKCGSKDIHITENKLHMLKKQGKFITDIGFSNFEDKFGITPIEDFTEKYDKPLLIIKEDKIKIPDKMTNDERIQILGRIDSIKSKIVSDIKESQDESFANL